VLSSAFQARVVEVSQGFALIHVMEATVMARRPIDNSSSR